MGDTIARFVLIMVLFLGLATLAYASTTATHENAVKSDGTITNETLIPMGLVIVGLGAAWKLSGVNSKWESTEKRIDGFENQFLEFRKEFKEENTELRKEISELRKEIMILRSGECPIEHCPLEDKKCSGD